MSEGKSETAANMAVSLAQAGHSTILIDADLRRPTIAKKLHVDQNSPGLSSVLARTARLNDCLIALDGVDNLMVLPSGPLPLDRRWSRDQPEGQRRQEDGPPPRSRTLRLPFPTSSPSHGCHPPFRSLYVVPASWRRHLPRQPR